MPLSQRHKAILDMVNETGSIGVGELAKEFNVSEVTIRKDLTQLEKTGSIYRAHGRAIRFNPYINDRDVNVKEKQQIMQKKAIGEYAARMISPNDSILIASGTTVMYLAREIVPQEHLTVITSAMNVSAYLSRNKDIDVIQLGGIARNSSESVVGHYAEEMLSNFACSKLFIGTDGIDVEYGLSTTNLLEASLNRMMIDASQKTIVLTDSTKFNFRGFSKICDIDRIDKIVTDRGIPQHVLKQLEERGIEVTVLDV